MTKNVIVTGAAGFLGSHLSLHHLKQGHRVLGLDNFSSSLENSRHVRLIHELYGPDKFRLCKVDICDALSMEMMAVDFLQNTKNYDLIYNFACPASPPIYQSIPIETLLTCTLGTANVLALAKKHNSIVVHASTSEIYGDPKISPQSENYRGHVNSYGPRACYDEGKRAAEALCYDYLDKYNLDVRVVRIFNTYGPHMSPNDGRVISNFITQLLKGESLTIYGDGSQTRSFCYVDDLISAITKMANLPTNPGTPINVGNPQEFTILELANQILNLFKKQTNVSLINKTLPIDDPLQRKPDIALANKILLWEPKTTLEEGVLKTFNWFQGEMGFSI